LDRLFPLLLRDRLESELLLLLLEDEREDPELELPLELEEGLLRRLGFFERPRPSIFFSLAAAFSVLRSSFCRFFSAFSSTRRSFSLSACRSAFFLS
jgi:hypothetical protein